MKEVFADSYYFLALLNPRDLGHKDAIAVSSSLSARLVTTEYILLEVGDAFSRRAYRQRFLDLLAALQSEPTTTIISADGDLLKRGIKLFADRSDKDWPLTDCLSFVVMNERGIAEALTCDDHFRQAGYTLLL